MSINTSGYNKTLETLIGESFYQATKTCTDPWILSYSTDLSGVPIKLQELMTILAAVVCLISVLISFFLICGHLFHWTKPTEQKHFVRIITFVPVYSICSFFSIWFYEAEGYLTPIGQFYEGYALIAMFLLYVEWITPEENRRAAFYESLEHRGLTGRKISSHGSLGWYRRMWILTFQITLTRISTLIAAMILFSTTCPLSTTRLHGQTAIDAISSTSTAFAVTASILYETRLRPYLHPYHAFFKLASFKGIIFLEAIQNIVFPVLAQRNVFKPSPPYRVSWLDFDRGVPRLLVVWEMLAVAVAFLWSFDFRPYLLEVREGRPVVAKPGRALLQSFDPTDVWRGVRYMFTCFGSSTFMEGRVGEGRGEGGGEGKDGHRDLLGEEERGNRSSE